MSEAYTKAWFRKVKRFAEGLDRIYARERLEAAFKNYAVIGYPLGKSVRGFKKWRKSGDELANL